MQTKFIDVAGKSPEVKIWNVKNGRTTPLNDGFKAYNPRRN